MTTQSSHASPILVTGAAGAVGSIGSSITEMLLAKGRKVRALVRREDERAEALRQLGAGRGEWVVALYCRLSRMVCTRVVAFC
jgi:nucleoside-diphosphate-sugar epimerase